MISGIRWQRCESCPAKFLVLAESERRECLRCERERKMLKRRGRESKRWHRERRKAEKV